MHIINETTMMNQTLMNQNTNESKPLMKCVWMSKTFNEMCLNVNHEMKCVWMSIVKWNVFECQSWNEMCLNVKPLMKCVWMSIVKWNVFGCQAFNEMKQNIKWVVFGSSLSNSMEKLSFECESLEVHQFMVRLSFWKPSWKYIISSWKAGVKSRGKNL